MLSSQLLARSGQLDSENAQTARQMINDLLDFTRARLGGGMPIATKSVDLERLCREVIDEFRVAHPDRTVRVDIPGAVTGEWDPARLRQVVSNLVANAIMHGEEGTPVEVSVKDEGSEIVLTVANRERRSPPRRFRRSSIRSYAPLRPNRAREQGREGSVSASTSCGRSSWRTAARSP